MIKKKTFGPLQITIDDGICTFQSDKIQIKARLVEENQNIVGTFFEINCKPIEESVLAEPMLFVAEAFLKTERVGYVNMLFKNEEAMFPIFESLKNLPNIDGEGRIVVVLDIYDGPIRGLIEIANDYYLFSWCMEALEEGFHKGPRIFYLRKSPKELHSELKVWVDRYLELDSELKIISNPHMYPISDWQKNQMRSSEQLQSLLSNHHEIMPNLECEPIMGWMEEFGEQFAAIRMIHMTKEESDYYSEWQNNLALALKAEDQNRINKLFEKRPTSVSDNTIFRTDIKSPDGEILVVLRDSLGQPLPVEFWLLPKHSVHDLTGLAKKLRNLIKSGTERKDGSKQ